MNWQDIKKAAQNGIQPVTGGFTKATRGVVTLPDGQTVFIKMAVDDMTQGWLDKEIKAYLWLNEHGYDGAPTMLANGAEGFALTDMSSYNWTPTWTHDKLRAMFACLDGLGPFSEAAKSYFPAANEIENTLAAYDYKTDNYEWIKTSHPELYQKVRDIVTDEDFMHRCRELAGTVPWRGTDLAHFDARSDNFGYDQAAKKGKLVDWNWACIGNRVFDKSIMLVSVYKTGFDVFLDCPEYLDPASISWIMGFWLMALYGKDDALLHDLRTHQVGSLLVAESMLRKLLS